MGKTKLRAWAALLTSVVLLGASIHVTNAEEVVDTYAAEEEGEAGTVSNTDTKLTSLSLGDMVSVNGSTVDSSSGEGWSYDVTQKTLHITGNVTVEGSAEKIISSEEDLIIDVANGATLTVKKNTNSENSYGIYATGNLNINVAENATLTVENSQTSGTPYGISAGGKLTLDGKGTIKVEAGKESYGVFSNQGITIKNMTLDIDNPYGYKSIAAGNTLEIEDAVVTVKGVCAALNVTTRYPVKILGNSIVNIDGSETKNAKGLQGSEFELSDNAHVKISSQKASIGDKDANLKLITEPAKGYYWKIGGFSTINDSWRTAFEEVNSCANSSFFEYIGSAHFKGDFKQNSDEKTHSKTCSCVTDPTTVTIDCSGGEATCTQRAICSVCDKEYGEQATNHDFNKYHICTKCGEVESGVAVTVTAGSEKRGYMKEKIDDAITYAVSQQGSVVKLYPDWSADTIIIDNAGADFTIDLNGQDMYNGVSVNAGTVTIKDSTENATGKIASITIGDKCTVSLENGSVSYNVAVEGGIFNVDGGTIAAISFDGGQVNWNSTAATVTSEIRYNDNNDNIMIMKAKPGKPLNIVLDARRDLEKSFAKVESGSIPDEYISTIRLVTDGTFYKYSLKPAIENNQLYAHFPLNQNEVDITLDTASDLVYNGSAREPVVTVQRYMLVLSGGKYVWDSNFTPLKEGRDFTVTYSDNTNAGTAKVTIKGIGCYTGSVERTFTIAKAAPKKSSITVDMSDRIYSCRTDNADQVDLTPYLPKDCGTVKAEVATSGDLSYRIAPKVTDGVLSFTTQQSTAAQTGTITVTVSTTNYEDFTITAPITTRDLGIVHPKDGTEVALQNNTLTEGEKLSKLTFKDVTFVDEDGKEVTGTLSWQTPDAVPALGTTSAQWVFRPDDTGSYAPLSGSIAITVQKKSDAGSGGTSSGGSSIGGGGGAAVSDPKQDDSKTDAPKTDDTKTDDKTDDTKQDAKTPASKGTKLKTSSGVSYQVISASSKAPKVTYRAAQKKAKGTVTIPKKVTIKGVRYQVTAIAAGAFSGCRNVKHIVVPSSVTAIGENAFADCAKLKTITINTTKLSSKNVADGAFDGIADGTVIRVPKRMFAKYQKLFEKKGLSDKVKLVSIKAKKK